MSRLLLALALVLGLGRVAAAQPAADGLSNAVAERVRATLPPELALVSTHAPMGWTFAPRDALSVEWKSPPRAGFVSVQISVRYADDSTRTGWAQVELRGMRRVLVTRRPLVQGGTLMSEDLALELRPVAPNQGFAMSPDVLNGARILRDVPADEAITAADVVAPAPIGRGHEISVVIAHGRLRVEARGVLERDARPGEPASAKLSDGSRIVTGRLVDSNTLVVEGML